MFKTSLICNNFSGINHTNSGFTSSIITASDLQNVELFYTGVNSGVGIRTAKGNICICDKIPSNENVIDIYESTQQGKTYFFIYTENSHEGKIYLFSPTANILDLKVSGLSKTGISAATDVAQGWKDLWVFSNNEQLLTIELGKYNDNGILDEITFINTTDSEGTDIKGLGLALFAGRLWIFNKQKLWYSVQENIYDFASSNSNITTSAGFIEFVKEITAIYPYLGTLAIFHKDSSCLLAQNDEKTFYKTQESPGGCAGQKALIFHGTELYFYDDTKKGIYSFREIVNGNKTLGENIALNIQEELCNIQKNDAKNIKTISVVNKDKNEVWILVPNSNENQYSYIFIYDYIHKCWIKRKSQKIYSVASIDGILYSAGKKIYQEYSSNNFDDEFIEAYYICTPLNLGKENSIKILSSQPKILLDMYYNNSFYVEYTKNYNIDTKKTRYIKAKTLKNILYFDIDKWDYSYYPIKDIKTTKKLPSSFFKTLQIKIFTQNKGDDFCIKNIEFEKIKIKD